ncbi:MAG: hypothetical protein JXR91_12615 [Deltaproteobacteria bacterium]|nr:hypothetical protein [Deltaproteobacteria bacterium]
MAEILIIVFALFFAGAILLLERHSLGKLAFVQPLVLLLITGYITGEPEIALWLGISLQLLSIGQSHYCNWALVSFVSSATLIILHHYNIVITDGSAESLVLIIASIVSGILSELYLKKMIRKNAIPMNANAVWQTVGSLDIFAKIIYKNLAKGFVLGGIESLLGTLITTILVYGSYGVITARPFISELVIITVPLFGVSVTLAAMSRKRYTVMAILGVILFFIMVRFL